MYVFYSNSPVGISVNHLPRAQEVGLIGVGVNILAPPRKL